MKRRKRKKEKKTELAVERDIGKQKKRGGEGGEGIRERKERGI